MVRQVTRGSFKRRLPASPASVGLARSYVATYLRQSGHLGAVEDAQLIAAELMTNAIQASGRLDAVALFIGEQPRGLVLAVWDGANGEPSPRPIPVIGPGDMREVPDEPGGWGLHIVRALARQVWTERPPNGHGKWVCALLGV